MFLGHIVSDTGIIADPKKIEEFVKMPTSKSTKQLRAFLGFINLYFSAIQIQIRE